MLDLEAYRCDAQEYCGAGSVQIIKCKPSNLLSYIPISTRKLSNAIRPGPSPLYLPATFTVTGNHPI
jgi:hypothetical protein